MTDVMLIDNILTSSDKQDIQFADAQWLYMNDNNNNGYSNYIQFLTTTLKNQFIDYHNAYFLIPITVVVAVSTLNFGYAPRPPMIAFRESVLSLFANITIATDQGQVLVNDINTMFINNLRLCVEHSFDWMTSEGSLLQFSYDRYQIQPNRYSPALNSPYSWNPNGSDLITYGYQAPQGTLLDALNYSPITNDPNTTGQYMLASSSAVTVTAGVITGIARNSPYNSGDTQNLLSGTTTNANYGAYIPMYTANGNIAYLHITYTSSTGSAVTAIQEIGGINLAAGVTTSGTAGVLNFPGYGSGLSALTSSAGYIYLEAVATVSAFPTGISGQSIISNANSPTQVPLSSFGGTCIVPLVVYIASGAVTLVQVGGLNLYTTWNPNVPATAPSGAVTNTSTPGRISGNLLVGAESMQANIGFKERVTHFQNQSIYQYTQTTPLLNNVAAHMYSFSAQVPLKMIHDLFMQLDIPIINVGWNIQLFLAQTAGPFATAQYPPFMTSNNTALQQGGQDDTASPAIFYGNFKGQSTPCRLYYRVVKFQPQDNSEMAKKLTAGFTKSFTFISTDWIIPQGGPISSQPTTSQIYLSQSVVHPLRLWALGYANNTTVNSGTANKPGQFIQSASYAPGVVTGLFNNVNVLVNNLPYYRQNLQNTHDLYEQLREQFNPDTGSMISYEDFANYKRTLCFDLTRIADRLQSPTEPVSLIFQGTRNDGLAYNLDMIFLVERKNQVTFRFSAADVAIVVGNLD